MTKRKANNAIQLADRERAILASFVFQTNRYGAGTPRTSSDILNVCPAVMHYLFSKSNDRGLRTLAVFGQHAQSTAAAICLTCDNLVRKGLLSRGPLLNYKTAFKGPGRYDGPQAIEYRRRRFLLTETGLARASWADPDLLPPQIMPPPKDYLRRRGRPPAWVKKSGINEWDPTNIMLFIAYAGIESPMPQLSLIRKTRDDLAVATHELERSVSLDF